MKRESYICVWRARRILPTWFFLRNTQFFVCAVVVPGACVFEIKTITTTSQKQWRGIAKCSFVYNFFFRLCKYIHYTYIMLAAAKLFVLLIYFEPGECILMRRHRTVTDATTTTRKQYNVFLYARRGILCKMCRIK